MEQSVKSVVETVSEVVSDAGFEIHPFKVSVIHVNSRLNAVLISIAELNVVPESKTKYYPDFCIPTLATDIKTMQNN